MKDIRYMLEAIELAKKGSPSPNPYVGCVIVDGKGMIGAGFHRKAGKDHAEIAAIKDAKKRGFDIVSKKMYVTLEPCTHFGKTPPCVDAIIREGIKEVVIALKDPNPVVSGKGIKKLRKAGIKVRVGLLKKEVEEQNKRYIKYITKKVPYVLLKSAMSSDGKISHGDGKGKKISGKIADKFVHDLRDDFDSILVGIGTVLKDDPFLTCRKKNGRDPVKIILDSKLRIPIDSNVLKNCPEKTIVFTSENFSNRKKKEIENLGTRVIVCGKDRVDIKKMLKILGKEKFGSLLVEGGSEINTEFITKKLFDEINLLVSPDILGGNYDFTVEDIKHKFRVKDVRNLGKDTLFILS